jgi:hypothetical protein
MSDVWGYGLSVVGFMGNKWKSECEMNEFEWDKTREREREREYCTTTSMLYGENRDIFWGLYETEWDDSALIQTTVCSVKHDISVAL